MANMQYHVLQNGNMIQIDKVENTFTNIVKYRCRYKAKACMTILNYLKLLWLHTVTAGNFSSALFFSSMLTDFG